MNLFRKTSLRGIALLLSAVILSSCGTGTSASSSSGVGYNLVVDNTSSVPVTNGIPQQFYVYVTNTGNGDATNINWSLDDIVKPKVSLFDRVKSALSSKKTLADAATGVNIVNPSDCTTIKAGQNCRILLSASGEGTKVLQSSAIDQSSDSSITQNMVTAYSATPVASVADDHVLTLSPLTNVNYGDGFAGYTFFITNNGTQPVSLGDSPVGSLPDGMSASPIVSNCPDPLPSGGECQVRLTVNDTSTSSSIGSTVAVTLTPSGKVNGVELPTQASQNLTVSNDKVGYPSLSAPAITATQSGDSSATGIISNTGSAPLMIGTITSSSSNLVVSSDNCSNQTLSPRASCTYKTSVDYSNINGSGSGVVTVPYNDGKTDGTTSTIASWVYNTASNVVTPSIVITSSGNLTQENKTQTITIKNIGNVALTNVTTPTVSPNLAQVALSGRCPSPLAVGLSCSYTLTYTPVAPSQSTSVSIGGVSVSYVDASGVTKTISSPSSTSVNLSSIFAGFIKTGGDMTLNSGTTSKVITLENTGNYDATLSSIAVSGDNLTLNQNTCTNGKTLKARDKCTLTVALTNSTTAGSGNGSLDVNYNNNNGNASTHAISNINWSIGALPSLDVSFAQSNLSAVVGSSQDVEVTLRNSGNTTLSSIVIPTLPVGFTWVVPTTEACTLMGQSLALNADCKLTLRYSPTTGASGRQVIIGKFSATTGVGGSYISASDYTVTATALTNDVLGGLPSSGLIYNSTWVASTQTQSSDVTIVNNSDRVINLTGTTVSSGLYTVTALGCNSGTLAIGGSCTLTVTGTYTSSVSGSVTVNYTDSGVAHSQSFNISATYSSKPTINPSLSVTRDPSGELTVLNNQADRLITLTLTNSTTVTNPYNSSSDGTLKVLASSLLPTGGNVSYVAQAGGTCTLSGNYIVLSNATSANSCTYKVVAKSSASAGTSGSSTASPSYVSASYSDTSTTAVDKNNTATSDYGVSYTVLAPVAALSTPTQSVGASAVSGVITTTPSIAGLTIDTSACTNLASNAECEIAVTMNTANVISGNLNSISLNFTGGTARLPNLPYSTIAPDAPAISVSMNVANCQAGTSKDAVITNPTVLPTCNINTSNMSAQSRSPVVTFTFSNSGAGVAKNFIVNTAALAAALGINYSSSLTTTCGDSVTGTNLAPTIGSCTIVVNPKISIAGSDATTQYDIGGTNGTSLVSVPYSYKYGTTSLLSGSGSSSIGLDVNIVAAKLTILPGSMSISQGGSSSITVTASDWYSAPPATATFTILPTSDITSTTCTFSGNSCSSTINVSPNAYPDSYTIKAIGGGITSAGVNISVVAPIPALSEPFGIAFNGGYAYITNSLDYTYTKCSIDNDGVLSSCVSSALPSSSGGRPKGITFKGNYAYIDNVYNYTKCSVGNDGVLSSCIQQQPVVDYGEGPSPAMDGSKGIAFSGNYVYFTNNGASVSYSYTRCNVDVNGNVNPNNCVLSSQLGNGSSSGIAFNGDYAYLLSSDVNAYNYCSVSNGNIGVCTPNSFGTSSTLNQDHQGIAFKGNYAYITSYDSNNSYTKCSVDGNGALSSCEIVTPQNSNLVSSAGVAFNGGYMYIINNYDNTASLGGNSYTKCSVDSSGLVDSASCTTITPYQ